MKILTFCLLLMFFSCSDEQKKDAKKVTEDFTGASAIKKGEELKRSIDSITDTQQRRAEELEKLMNQ